MTLAERKLQNTIHAYSPEVGDYWNEHLVGVLVVLEVLPTSIVFCKTRKDIDSTHWTWNLDVIHDLSRKGFRDFLRYSSTYRNFWATVTPKIHAWAAQAALEI